MHDVVAKRCRKEELKMNFTLPCAGIVRTGTKGVISPAGAAAIPAGRRTPSVAATLRETGTQGKPGQPSDPMPEGSACRLSKGETRDA